MNPLDLDADALQQRSKTLDLREALLNEKERQLDEKAIQSKLDVLIKQVEAKEDYLNGLHDKILEADAHLGRRSAEIEQDIQELEDQRTAKEQSLGGFEQKKQDLQATTSELRKEITAINQSIKDRKSYLDAQEISIDGAIREWNDQLNDLRFEMEKSEKDRQKCLTDIVRLEDEHDKLVVDIEEMDTKLLKLDDTYETKLSEYKANLKAAQLAVDQKNKWLDETNTRYEIKERDFTAREKAIQVQTVVQTRKERELTSKERKLRMDYSLAGEDFEL